MAVVIVTGNWNVTSCVVPAGRAKVCVFVSARLAHAIVIVQVEPIVKLDGLLIPYSTMKLPSTVSGFV